MATYFLQFESRALPGEDAAYSRWYADVHIPDVLRIPGFIRVAARYRILNEESQPRYLVIYEVETEDPKATLATLFEAAGKMQISAALDPTHVQVQILERLPA